MRLLLIIFIINNIWAEPITQIIEFFSFKCHYCEIINSKLSQYVNEHSVQFVDINADNSQLALSTTIMYYIAVDAGIGQKFKSKYFEALRMGMPVYDKSTLDYVYRQIATLKFKELMQSPSEKEQIKNKLNFANDLLKKYNITVTPTFIINKNILIIGADSIDLILENQNV